MKLQILGIGCPRCKALEQNTRDALAKLGLEADIEKVTDIDRIMDMGVMMTPALALDGVMLSVGKVLSSVQIAELLTKESH
ncbi:MAG: thioredoxin family protein [Caldiserica bacterium]|nr:thioredoxin family protein [Caldisericota bacterium]